MLYGPIRRWWLLAVLSLVTICSGIDRSIVAVMVESIKAEFHATDTMMGLLTGFAFSLFYALFGIPIARYADRGDRRLLITVSVAIWSLLTVACGYARSFAELAFLRVGVGIGEAGSGPPYQSLLADYFAPTQRSLAFACVLVAGSVGALGAFVGGAELTVAYGWRTALIAVGVPGLILALITGFGLDEPRRRPGARDGVMPQERFLATLSTLLQKPSYLLINISAVFYFTVAYGVGNWSPAYLQRVLHLKLTEASGIQGVVSIVTIVVGALGGGVLFDRLAKRDIRWLARGPGILLLIATPIYMLTYAVSGETRYTMLAIGATLPIAAALPALLSVLQSVAGSVRRGMAAAIFLFLSNLVGAGLGPLVIGVLSDAFTAHIGPTGLRWAMVIGAAMLAPCGVAFWCSARTLEQDMED
jgi:MFS family permease